MSEVLKIEKEKELWKENLKIVDNLKCKETDILDLDLGGTHKITTTRNTLTKVKFILILMNFPFFSIQILLYQPCLVVDMRFQNIMEDYLLTDKGRLLLI